MSLVVVWFAVCFAVVCWFVACCLFSVGLLLLLVLVVVVVVTCRADVATRGT